MIIILIYFKEKKKYCFRKKTKFNLHYKKIYETRSNKHFLNNLISPYNEEY